MDELLMLLLAAVNETLTAAIVILTASLLLYNLTRNLTNRVARTSAIVLACVTVVYVCDVFIALEPSRGTLEATLRVQWIGIALIPAAMFHLSDALLATTGLPSRGRRRRVTRMLYLLGTLFILLAAFSDLLTQPTVTRTITQRAGPIFPVYVVYFLVATGVAFINVQRARQRCLTRDTRRRMAYLQLALLTPAFGIFPYSLVLGLSETASVGMLVLVNLANVVIILLLLFLAYPLSFFGTHVPDRVVKAELLRFMLRGPATGLLALAVIIFTRPATRILGLPGESFVPFAVVAVVLLWQWTIALALPWLEKRLIYSGEDADQVAKLQSLSDRLLTRTDLLQLLDAILAACCDYLQVSTAFAIAWNETAPELVASVGPTRPNQQWLEAQLPALLDEIEANPAEVYPWHAYWLIALHSRRALSPAGEPLLVGLLGIQARSAQIDLTTDEQRTLQTFARRAAETLDDLRLQTEIYAALEGLLPQISVTRTRASQVEYRQGREALPASVEDDVTLDRELFVEQVRAALRHYWGGPGLASSRLLELAVVQQALPQHGNNPARALRAVLLQAIEKLKPPGERKLLSPEWMIYNIIEQRFIERHKVRDVAIRLALSEPDLYRKQRIAIEAVADVLFELEKQQHRAA